MLFCFTMIFVAAGLVVVASGEWLGLVFGGLGGGLGIAAMAVFVERLQVVLDARAGVARISRRTMFRQRETGFDLSRVLGAELQNATSNRDGRRRTLSRPAFKVTHGTDLDPHAHPITEIYSSGRGPETLVTALNHWLEAHRSGDQGSSQPTSAPHPSTS